MFRDFWMMVAARSPEFVQIAHSTEDGACLVEIVDRMESLEI